ncbi:DUF6261 family protein [Carboxylicivirga sp. N1Y90]|uniref:DUF6261 family protein n=1 Tax=Carboxylicivirga fragile TaxID=3417571 RepID=UPI003D34D860|nr:hypothetical protein [Marinilabiliaceae bacterium N1Y90]
MTKIEKIITNTRSAEANDLCTSISSVIDKAGIDDPHLSATKAEIDASNLSLTQSIKKDKAESVLDERDDSRDAVYRSILHLNKGYLHHPDTKVKESATHAEAVIEKYGFELTDATYSAQSALVDSFMADMAQTELATDLAVLPGISGLLEQLSQEQASFKLAESELLAARSNEQQASNATAVKKDLLKLVNNKLVVYLRAMLQVNPAQYKDVATQIALLIDKSNTVVKRRRK